MTGIVDASIGGGPWGPSYRVEAEGGTVRWSGTEGGHDDQATVRPEPEAWQRFWAAVDTAGAWSWSASYDDPDVLDGTSWSLRLAHDGRAVESGGSNAWPPDWEQVQAALEQLAGKPWR